MTPTGAPGAVGVVQLFGNVDAALDLLGIRPVRPGEVALRSLCGIDHGLAARWTETCIQLMPHGGATLLRQLAAIISDAGLAESAGPDPLRDYPEASTHLEARMLDALARASSPLAINLLLDQPRRWWAEGEGATFDPDHSRTLNRLIDPPLVVAVGPANVGKSTLVNALAGRPVSIVADEPGTTRDHVGVLIDMAGLVVRYIDTPGIRPPGETGAIEREAGAIAERVRASADLIISCGDVSAAPVGGSGTNQVVITIATRADLGAPPWPADAAVSAARGTGLSSLVELIRNRLAPPEALADPRPWKFW